jgi:hypothetical protein
MIKKGSLVSVCRNCKRVFNFRNIGFTTKKLDYPKGIMDVGIECPNCENFTHSYYLTDELEKMQKPDATRDEKREYKRKLRKLQGWVSNKRRNASKTSTHGQ